MDGGREGTPKCSHTETKTTTANKQHETKRMTKNEAHTQRTLLQSILTTSEGNAKTKKTHVFAWEPVGNK